MYWDVSKLSFLKWGMQKNYYVIYVVIIHDFKNMNKMHGANSSNPIALNLFVLELQVILGSKEGDPSLY